MKLKLFAILSLLSMAFAAQAQTYVNLDVKVNTVAGDNLSGQRFSVTHTGYELTCGPFKLDAEGTKSCKVYAGTNRLELQREGFEDVAYLFDVPDTGGAVEITLVEKTRKPFALTAATTHNVYTGANDVTLTWNTEAPAFFDDFESYDPFSIAFGQWTGIDADGESAASLVGSYKNRGVLQYAQIINPLAVTPIWWYDYPVLNPYDGQQYVGFTRTESGNANDDWLISPVVTPGTANVLRFMAKAADVYDERFQVYVTTKVDNPGVADFTRIDMGNYEKVDAKQWHTMTYDLSAYEGTPIKFAIRYIGNASRYGAFMLMVDNVYVGPAIGVQASVPARRVASRRSAANRYEHFNIYLDGTLIGTTDDYSYTLADVPAGTHTVGVEATYRVAKSEIATITIEVGAENYAKVDINVTANSALAADRIEIGLLHMETAENYTIFTDGGKVSLASLPYGRYTLFIAEGAYVEHTQEVIIAGDMTIDIALNDRIIAPANITSAESEDGSILLQWNRELAFCDSFEDYDDFARGSFGRWTTVDKDGYPVYPIALSGDIIGYPGSGDQFNPQPCAPMVFNPWHTTPAMLPTDVAVTAPTGDKTIIFLSSQQAYNDKWLISPVITIRPGYVLTFLAKAYSPYYPESMQVCVAEDPDSGDYIALARIDELMSEAWGQYTVDLDVYEGMDVRLALNYTSYDGFFAQVDDFTVGPESGEGELVDFGNIVRFDIYLDGTKVGESKTAAFALPRPADGTHTVGIKAIYLNGESAMTEYELGVDGVAAPVVAAAAAPAEYYDLTGRRLSRAPESGIYIVKTGTTVKKIAR